QAFLDRRSAPAKDNPWAKRFQRAGAETAIVTMFVNPRMLDAEVLQNSKKNDPLSGYSRAPEAHFVTVTSQDDAELRIQLPADAANLPEWAKSAFTQTTPASSLWEWFPERSILTIAARTDFAGAADALKLVMPEKDRRKLTNDWQGSVGALLRLDTFK